LSRALWTIGIIGGGYAYYSGLAEDAISYVKMRFALVDALSANKDSAGSVYKLPRPKKADTPPTDTPPTAPPPDVPDTPPPPPLDVVEEVQSEPIDAASPPQKVEAVPDAIKEDISEITEEMHRRMVSKYKALREEMARLAVDSETEDAVDNVIDIAPSEPPAVSVSDGDGLRAEVAALRRSLEQKSLTIEELERELRAKSDFIGENLKKLEEGRNAYDEIAAIFEEMRVEYQEAMVQQMEHLENERRDRMEKLKRFAVDIRVMEQVMNWYDVNNRFFMDLAEINNVVHRLEGKMNGGLAFDNELDYLLKTLPGSFVSHRLLSDLRRSQNGDRSFHINSHQQLYDRFAVLEHALRETAMTPKSTQSLWGNVLAKVFSSLLVREEVDRKGTRHNDRISRAGFSMKLGDLGSAVSELSQLDEDLLYPAQSWLNSARQRMLGVAALRMLKSELLSRSLKMAENE